MGVEYNHPAHLLDRYIKGGDINSGRLYCELVSGELRLLSNVCSVMMRGMHTVLMGLLLVRFILITDTCKVIYLTHNIDNKNNNYSCINFVFMYSCILYLCS